MDLKDAPLFRDLSKAEFAEITNIVVEKSFKKNAFLFQEGACCKNIFVVREGLVKLMGMSVSGREFVLETLGPGDTCACHINEAPTFCSGSAEAVTDCRVWFMPREDYLQLAQTHAGVMRALNRHFSEKLRRARQALKNMSLLNAKSRLASYLLDRLPLASSKKQKITDLLVPSTREEIAQELGMARETVTRQLYLLKRAKLIDVQPHHIIILDQEGLQKLL